MIINIFILLPQVGLAAIQIAKGLGASRVISTAGTEEGIQLAYEHGADVVRNYKSPDFKQTLKVRVQTL